MAQLKTKTLALLLSECKRITPQVTLVLIWFTDVRTAPTVKP